MQRIKIRNRTIGDGEKAFIILDVGSNHDRKLWKAKKMIDIAAKAGVGAVKFQTYSAETMYSRYAPRLKEMDGRTKKRETPFELIKRISLPRSWQKKLKRYCDSKKLIFMSTPFDYKAVDELDALNVPAFKVASYELTDLEFLEYIAKKGKPILLSTGMASLGEIEEAISAIQKHGNNKIILLLCTSQYPTKPEDINLRSMLTLKKAFSKTVGFSDHSLDNYAAFAAVALGAKVIEKHFTLNRKSKGPDHSFSLEPNGVVDLVNGIRTVETALGSPIKKIRESEKENKAFGTRSIHAKKDIWKGEQITRANTIIKRPGLGIKPKFLEIILGRKAKRDIKKDEWVSWKMV